MQGIVVQGTGSKVQGAGHKAREHIGEENRSKTGEYLMINPRTAESVEIRCY